MRLRRLVVCSLAVGALSTSCTGPSAEELGSLTEDQYATATAIARDAAREAEADDGEVTGAFATVRNGTEPDSNTGDYCTSGRLLEVVVTGTFPNITVLPGVVPPGTTSDDVTVRGMVLVADAETGKVCMLGHRTKDFEPDPGSAVIDVD